MRVVIDTNIWVSAVIRPRGVVGRLIPLLRTDSYTPLFSTETLKELVQVLGRPRFQQKYGLGNSDIRVLVALLMEYGEIVEPTRNIIASRDLKDDMFLEIAVAGGAAIIVSGDRDLLVLHPFAGIPILTPAAFLQMIEQET